MNVRKFLQEFEKSNDRDRMVDIIYDEMVEFCREEGITENEISTTTLERLAEGFVERGFGVPPSGETVASEERFRRLTDEELDKLKGLATKLEEQEYEYSWTEELGSATDGSEQKKVWWRVGCRTGETEKVIAEDEISAIKKAALLYPETATRIEEGGVGE